MKHKFSTSISRARGLVRVFLQGNMVSEHPWEGKETLLGLSSCWGQDNHNRVKVWQRKLAALLTCPSQHYTHAKWWCQLVTVGLHELVLENKAHHLFQQPVSQLFKSVTNCQRIRTAEHPCISGYDKEMCLSVQGCHCHLLCLIESTTICFYFLLFLPFQEVRAVFFLFFPRLKIPLQQ